MARSSITSTADLERGRRIKELREARHMTQPAVADLVGVTPRAYQKWEAGGGLHWNNTQALAEAFGVDTADILGRTREPPDRMGALSNDDHLVRIDARLGAIEEALGDLRELIRAVA